MLQSLLPLPLGLSKADDRWYHELCVIRHFIAGCEQIQPIKEFDYAYNFMEVEQKAQSVS